MTGVQEMGYLADTYIMLNIICLFKGYCFHLV